MWTTFEAYKDKLSGAGYLIVRCMTKDETNLPEPERTNLEKKLSCFAPCTLRATNDFKDRWALAYCIDLYLNPKVCHFFSMQNEVRTANGLDAIEINQALYSLSGMLQWIFRSRIRDKQSIFIYIPSNRMRKLLTDWLGMDEC